MRESPPPDGGGRRRTTVGELAAQIRFRWVGPDAPAPTVRRWERFEFRARRLGRSLEPLNTLLPPALAERRPHIRALLGIPRMSTFAIGALTNLAVARMHPDHAYVNVGVWHGFTFLAGLAGNAGKNCVGVDDFSQFGGPRAAFHERLRRYPGRRRFLDMDYRAYFESEHRGGIGVYYYDGPHGYEHQLRGLEIAEPFLAPGCVVLVDDWNDEETQEATREFLAGAPEFALTFAQVTAADGHPTFWNGFAVLERAVASTP